jgi:hypothetical protein
MLTIAANATIAGVAASGASEVTCTLFLMELNGTTETYTSDQQQLAATVATIYTATANGPTFVRSIHVVNTDTANNSTFQLFVGGTAQANAITPVMTLLPGGMAVYEDGTGWQFYTSSGQLLTSVYAAVPPTDNWGISGTKGETMDRNTCPEVNTVVGTTGQIRVQAIWLTAGTVVTNIVLCSATTAASGPTHYVAALYDLTGALLATSADKTSTAWGANTMVTFAMNTPYTIPTTGLYYVMFSMTASTTVVTLKGGTATTDGQLRLTAPVLQGISATAYATGTAPASIGVPSAKNTASIWAAVT